MRQPHAVAQAAGFDLRSVPNSGFAGVSLGIAPLRRAAQRFRRSSYSSATVRGHSERADDMPPPLAEKSAHVLSARSGEVAGRVEMFVRLQLRSGATRA